MIDKNITAAEAESLKNNRILKAALSRLNLYVDDKMINCDPYDLEQASRVVQFKQLCLQFETELMRLITGCINDEKIAQASIKALESRREHKIQR